MLIAKIDQIINETNDNFYQTINFVCRSHVRTCFPRQYAPAHIYRLYVTLLQNVEVEQGTIAQWGTFDIIVYQVVSRMDVRAFEMHRNCFQNNSFRFILPNTN